MVGPGIDHGGDAVPFCQVGYWKILPLMWAWVRGCGFFLVVVERERVQSTVSTTGTQVLVLVVVVGRCVYRPCTSVIQVHKNRTCTSVVRTTHLELGVQSRNRV